jgi:integral membrane protein (TIGR01906 family)
MKTTSVLRLLLTLAIPLLLVIGSVRVVMTRTWLFWEYTRPGLTVDSYGFNARDRLAYGPYGIDYLIERQPTKYLADIRLPAAKCLSVATDATDCAAFTEDELGHMADVQRVTSAVFMLGLGALVIGVLSALLLWRHARSTFFAALRDGGVLTLGLMATIVLLASVAWDLFFDQFHALFFSAGTWQFEFSQTLIRLYPEQFWFDAVLTIGVMVIVGALLLLAWGLRGMRESAN